MRVKKQKLRQTILQRRNAMTSEQRRQQTTQLLSQWDSLFAFVQQYAKEARAVVGGYWPIGSEADVRPLLNLFAQLGYRLALPSLNERRMVFRSFSFGDHLAAMAFGTEGPASTCNEEEPSILLTPLVAFDRSGNRLGYGGGFYDRYLTERLNRGGRPLCIGIAYSLQQVENIPVEPFDIALDACLTEEGLRSFSKFN